MYQLVGLANYPPDYYSKVPAAFQIAYFKNM
jgi:hypothetical protein